MENGAQERGRTIARGIWIGVAIALVARLASLVPAVIDDDEAWFAASARALRRPFEFFRFAPDNKPPGTVWFYEAVRTAFGAAHLPQTARFVGILLIGATALLLARIARRFSEDAPPRAALLFVLASGAIAPKLLALTNEQLMVFAATLAVSAALTLRGHARWLLAGASIALACWVKQTGLVFLLPVLLACDSWLAAVLVLVSFVAVVALQILGVGPAEFWHWTFAYPREVLVRAREVAFSGVGEAVQSVIWVGVALLPIVLRAFAGARETGEARTRRVMFGWFVAALAAIAVGKGLFLHYFLLVLPPLCLWAAVAGLRARWQRVWLWTAYALSVLIAAVPLSALFWGNDLDYFARVASRIDQLTPAHGGVFLWGGSPVPLALARTDHATRFITSRFLVFPYATEATEVAFREDFAANPPSLVVDLHARGDNRQNVAPEEIPWLADELRLHYFRLADPALPWVRFYRRNDTLFAVDRRGLCHSVSDPTPAATYPGSLAILKTTIATLRARPLALFSMRDQDRAARAGFALETLATSCGGSDPAPVVLDPATVRATFTQAGFAPPLALDSPAWWIRLAIVQMQPVIDRRR